MILHGIAVLQSRNCDPEVAEREWGQLDGDQRQALAFYLEVEDQIVSIGVLAVGLSLPALVIALALGNYPDTAWHRLIDDARLLFARHGWRRATTAAQTAQGLNRE